MTPEAAEAVIRASLLRDAPPSLCWAVLVCHRAFISSDDFFAVLRRILEEKNASVVPGLVRLVSAWTLQLPPSPRDDPKTYGALREFLIKLSEESRTESSCTRLLRELDKEKVTGEEESVIPVTLGGGVHLSWTNVEVSKLALALSHMTQELLSRVPHSELLSARWTGRDDAKVGTSKTALGEENLIFFPLLSQWLLAPQITAAQNNGNVIVRWLSTRVLEGNSRKARVLAIARVIRLGTCSFLCISF